LFFKLFWIVLRAVSSVSEDFNLFYYTKSRVSVVLPLSLSLSLSLSEIAMR
jgi:hypothetical protein